MSHPRGDEWSVTEWVTPGLPKMKNTINSTFLSEQIFWLSIRCAYFILGLIPGQKALKY